MKIIFIRSNPITPDPRVEKEAKCLLDAGHKIILLGWNRDVTGKTLYGKKSLDDSTEVDIVTFNIKASYGGGMKKNFIPLILFQIKIVFWLIKNRKSYDIIHACDFDTVLPAVLLKYLFKKDYIYDIFDYYVDAFNIPRYFKKFIQVLDHFSINKAKAVILCSEKRIQQIEGSSPNKIIIIHNTPNSNVISNKVIKEGETNKVKIVYVGILSENRFIKELIHILKNRADCEFHIGGFGELEEFILEMSKTYTNIKYYGRLQYSDTIKLESYCDIMTAIYDPDIPNHKYAAPNKFYEALMLGKPLIMIKNTGMDYILTDNEIGVVSEYNLESIEKSIDRLIQKRNEWGIMSQKMINLYNSQFSWEKMEIRLRNLYTDIEKEHRYEKNNICM